MSDSVIRARNLSGGRSGAPNSEATEAETLDALAARVQALEQQLRTTEERYQQIFNNAHDIVYVLDMEGAFMAVNATALRLTGFTLDEVRGKPYSIVVAPEYLEVTRENVRRKLAGAGPTTYEIELVAKDGRRIPIEVSSQLLMADGRPVGIQGIARDITERKRHEVALQNSEAQAQRHEAQIRQQLERLTALYGVAEQLSLTLDLQHLAHDIVRACVESFGVTVAWLGRAESPSAIHLLAHYPQETDFPRHIAANSDESGRPHNVAMQALRTGIPAVQTDITEQPVAARWRGPLQDLAVKSIGAFPLISRDRPVGVLSLYTAQPGFFSPERIEFFQAYTHQVAAALENARLYDETERRLRQLQALRDIDAAISGSLDVRVTFNVFLGHVISLLRADAAAVLLFNPHLQALEYCAGRGFRTAAVQHGQLHLGEGHAGRAALERRMVTVTNLDSDPGDASRSRLLAAEKFSGYVAVPLMAKVT